MTKYVNNNGVSEMWLNIKNWVTSQLLGYSQTGHTHSASDITSGLATVATSGSYNDLSNKPTIPTVNNATLKIQKNGTDVKTFTANASSDVTCNITVPTKVSELTNDSNFITEDTTKIPLSGTSALSGSIVPDTNNAYNLGDSSHNYKIVYAKEIRYGLNTSVLILSGGNGANIELYGSNISMYAGWVSIKAINNNGQCQMILRPDGTWTWTGQAVQLISDQRLKQQIAEIDDKLLDAWEDVEPVQFKYNDAVDQKGNTARLHTGYVVQQIDDACKKHNVDVSKYGLYCHEVYQEETREVEQADGTKTTEVVRPASEHYSLRYTEALIVECAYLRKCIKELRNEIEQLKSGK